MSDYLIQQLRAATNITIRYRTEVVAAGGDQRLQYITVRDANTGATETLETAGLFVLIGSQPQTEWLPDTVERDQWGFVLTGTDASSGLTAGAASSLQGVFAAGDVRRGSIKRVAFAVGEGAAVITEVQQYLAELHRATATPTAPPR